MAFLGKVLSLNYSLHIAASISVRNYNSLNTHKQTYRRNLCWIGIYVSRNFLAFLPFSKVIKYAQICVYTISSLLHRCILKYVWIENNLQLHLHSVKLTLSTMRARRVMRGETNSKWKMKTKYSLMRFRVHFGENMIKCIALSKFIGYNVSSVIDEWQKMCTA